MSMESQGRAEKEQLRNFFKLQNTHNRHPEFWWKNKCGCHRVTCDQRVSPCLSQITPSIEGPVSTAASRQSPCRRSGSGWCRAGRPPTRGTAPPTSPTPRPAKPSTRAFLMGDGHEGAQPSGGDQPACSCFAAWGREPPPFEGFVKTGPGLTDAWQRIHAGEAVDLLPMCANPSLTPGIVVPRCSRCEVPHKSLAFFTSLHHVR